MTTTTTTTGFLSLPYELRQSVLQHALRQKGTVELQHPVWAGLQVFYHPLYHVSRNLRDEALEAFYSSNDFLWIIDTGDKLPARSNPADYPAPTALIERGKYIAPSLDPPLTPILPWEYPHLLRQLRHLQINVYLPQENDASDLEDRLRGLVKALDHGRRLAEFHVLITGKRRGAQIPLTPGERKALEVLADMEVRGSVEVQTRYYFRAVNVGVQGLNLKKRMKA